MPSPQQLASLPLSSGANRQPVNYETKPPLVTAHYAYVEPQHAHPTAYYVFDMLFKLAISLCLIGIVIALFVSIGESNKKAERLVDRLDYISNDLEDITSELDYIHRSMVT